MSDVISASKIHELQISDKELYAFEPLICDAIYDNETKIADSRKKLGIPSEYPDQLELLADIQVCEGKIVILKDILSQPGMPWQC